MANSAYIGQKISIQVEGGTLHGVLQLPTEIKPSHVVIIISGSGATDRDGNNPLTGGYNNSLKQLAESLAANGIASVRYDKRGVGKSAQAITGEEHLCFDTYVEDAVLWGEKLRKDRRFTHVSIIGHSEGSLVGMIACRKLGGDAFVSIAGAGIRASQILLRQLKPKLSEILFHNAKSIVDRLDQEETVDPVTPELIALFRPSVQPYLISWFRYDPALEVAKLKVPTLILHGETDIQVLLKDATTLAKSNTQAKQITIRGMNHVLKKVSGDLKKQIDSYTNPELPIMEALVGEITAFLMTV
ncbi:MAG: alpha/beta hydrolase, partial [Sedimenticola sp.]